MVCALHVMCTFAGLLTKRIWLNSKKERKCPFFLCYYFKSPFYSFNLLLDFHDKLYGFRALRYYRVIRKIGSKKCQKSNFIFFTLS